MGALVRYTIGMAAEQELLLWIFVYGNSSLYLYGTKEVYNIWILRRRLNLTGKW